MMNPRVILEHLIARLEPEVGGVTEGDFCAWEGEEAALRHRMAHGRGHRAQALLTAKEALRSGDDEKITAAALICPALERTGNAGHVERGVKILRSAAEGHAQTHGTSEQKELRRGEIFRAYQRALDSGLNKTGAQALAAEKCGVSTKTVQRAIKNSS